MKKLIYYIAVAVLAVILTVAALTEGGTPATNKNDYGLFGTQVIAAAEDNIEKLTDLQDDEVYDYILDEISDIAPIGSVWMDIVPDTEYSYTYTDYTKYFGAGTIFAPQPVKNIMVTVSTTNSTIDNDVLIISAHYDRAFGSKGAYDSALNVAIMLENLKLLASSTQQIKDYNTIAFLFTDGYHQGNIGLRKFLEVKDDQNPFAHPDEKRLLANAKLIVNLENHGAGGALTLYGTSKADYNLVNLYIGGGGKAATAGSAFKEAYASLMTDGTADIWNTTGVPLLSFGAFGDGHIINTRLDRYDESFNRDLLISSGVNLSGVINTFGNINLDTAVTVGLAPDAVYFGYLSLFTVNMSFLGVLIILIFTLLIFAAALFLNHKREEEHRYKFYKILLAATLSLVFILAAFFGTVIFKLILGIFGGVFGAILASPFYSSVILLAGFVLFGLGLVALSQHIYEKHIKTRLKYPEGMPGEKEFHLSAGFIFILLTLVFTVLLPSVSYLFCFAALISAVELLVKNALKKESLEKYNFGIIGAALSIPLYISFARGLYFFSGAAVLVEVVPLFGLLFLYALPYVAKININTKITVKDKKAAHAEGGVPAKKQLKITSLIAAGIVAVMGFAFILSGGLDGQVRGEFGAALTKNNQSTFERYAYYDAVSYVYSQEITGGANPGQSVAAYAGSHYMISGVDNYNYLSRYTSIFSGSGGLYAASAENLSPAGKPLIGLHEPRIPEAGEGEEGDPVEIIYSIDINMSDSESMFELIVPNPNGLLSAVTIIPDGEGAQSIQFDDFGAGAVKLYYDKNCKITLFYDAPVNITAEFRYVLRGALNGSIPTALSALEAIDLDFNIIFKYSIKLETHTS